METVGIFIQGTTAIGVLVVATLTFMGRSTNALREDIGALREDIKGLRTDMNGEMKSIRTEMNEKFTEVRAEMHSMNTRLGRVEGHLRISDNNQADHK